MTTSTWRNAGDGQPSRRPGEASPRVIAGRYRLDETIGRGAMGIVWRARDELLDRVVAVKEVRLPPSLSDTERENSYQRTLREARTAARLSHPGVAAVYDVVEESGRPWIVMELVPGRSLEQVLAEDGPLSPQRAADVGRQVLAALSAAHRAGVMHRDVKPSNVLITRDGRTVLTDFGIATVDGDPSLTQTGIVMGSPGFLAPERIRGGVATPASDLWSLGATLYAAVEGQGPYDRRGGAMTTMAAVVTEDPKPPKGAGPLLAVIGALLTRDPAQRPSMVATRHMLESIAATGARAAGAAAGVAAGAATWAGAGAGTWAAAGAGARAAAGAAGAEAGAGTGAGAAAGAGAGAAGAGAGAGARAAAGAAGGAAGVEAGARAAAGAGAGARAGTGAGAGARAGAGAGARAAAGAAGVEAGARAAGAAGADVADATATDPLAAVAGDEASRMALQRETGTPAGPSTETGPAVSPGGGSRHQEVLRSAAVPAPGAAGPAAYLRMAQPATHTGTTPPARYTGGAPPATQAGSAQPATHTRSAPPATHTGSAPPATHTGVTPPGAYAHASAAASMRPAHSAPLGPPSIGPTSMGRAGTGRGRVLGYPGGGAAHARKRSASGRVYRIITFTIIGAAIFVAAGLAAAEIQKAKSVHAHLTPPPRRSGQSAAPGAVTAGADALPVGFRWYAQRAGTAASGTAGFRVAVPVGWLVKHRGLKTFVEEPGGYRFLEVDLTPHSFPVMLTEAQYLQDQSLRQGTFPGYQLGYIRPARYQGAIAADWMFSWQNQTSGRTVVLDRAFMARGPTGSQSFAIYWSTPSAQWQASRPLLFEVVGSFRPVWG